VETEVRYVHRLLSGWPRTADDFLGVIFATGRKALTRKRLERPLALAAFTMGTLTATKLLLRLQNNGGLEFLGDPHAWERIEQFSDDLVPEYYDSLANDLGGLDDVLDARRRTERPYLHLVRSRKTFHWCPTAIRPTDTTPIPPAWLEVLPLHAVNIENRIVQALAAFRRSPAMEPATTSAAYVIAETIALVAAAKLVLSPWGNGDIAAAFELLAEEVSALDYLRCDQPRP